MTEAPGVAAPGLLSGVTAPEPDGILRLMRAHAEDPRPDKVDLGVGVYRDAGGRTPIMVAVRAAERRIWEAETTKSYISMAGDPAFLAAVHALVLGSGASRDHLRDRWAAIATPGGTGAVRQAFDLVAMAAREAGRDMTVWVSDPTWPNHRSILSFIGQRCRAYRWLDRATGGMDREGLWADLAELRAGDVVVLHGCCHNPCGVDPAQQDWADLARHCAERGALPIVDLAYQGFGTGLEADVAGLRAMVAAVPEALICVSGSKSFGLYRERVGAVFALCDGTAARARVQARLEGLNRQAFTFPPDHGARVVTEILTDEGLRATWVAELDQMRARVADMRRALADALRSETGSDRFGMLAAHRGMFSVLPATPDQMDRLRVEHGLYAVQDGRINIAGLTPGAVPSVAKAIAAVLG